MLVVLVVVAFLSDGTPRIKAFTSPDMASCKVTQSIADAQLSASKGVVSFMTKCEETGLFES